MTTIDKEVAALSGFIWSILQLWVELPVMLGYIRGQSFKRPLTKKEEEQCLARLFAGDETAKDELIERNMRLVAHVVKKFQPKHEMLDDYISIGTIGLMKAINMYTPDRKTKLSTYAARCIENEILMHLRKQKKTQKDISLYEPIGGNDEGQPLEIADILQSTDESPNAVVLKNERRDRLYKHLGKLNARELEIIQRRFGLLDQQPMTQKAIAEQLNISRSYVSRIEKRAIIKLYQLFKYEAENKEQ